MNLHNISSVAIASGLLSPSDTYLIKMVHLKLSSKFSNNFTAKPAPWIRYLPLNSASLGLMFKFFITSPTS